MTVVRTQRSGHGYDVRLTACPACGKRFEAGRNRRYHIAGHAPEDFGLSPLGGGE